jgi:hypothetical protein
MSYAAHALITIVPFAALAAVSIILTRRHATLDALLAALGFGSVVLSQLMAAFVGFYTYTVNGDPVAAFSRASWTLPVTRWGIVIGIWVGSLSLLWHTLRYASPNNRRRGP